MKEGCLTFPLFLPIKRPKWVKVKYENDDKETVEEYLHDINARVFQHEYDHMEGIVFTSLVSKEKLKYYEKKKKRQSKMQLGINASLRELIVQPFKGNLSKVFHHLDALGWSEVNTRSSKDGEWSMLSLRGYSSDARSVVKPVKCH